MSYPSLLYASRRCNDSKSFTACPLAAHCIENPLGLYLCTTLNGLGSQGLTLRSTTGSLVRSASPYTDVATSFQIDAAFKTLPLRLHTPDGVELGAWYILSEPSYHSGGGEQRSGPPSEEEVRQSIADHPTVLFFHGNAASRAVKYRVQMYGQVTSRLGKYITGRSSSICTHKPRCKGANVLVIDYRGFGDSEGTPTELGLNIDAATAWEWLIEQGADPKNVLVMGHSLGTGVATKLVTQLGVNGKFFDPQIETALNNTLQALCLGR